MSMTKREEKILAQAKENTVIIMKIRDDLEKLKESIYMTKVELEQYRAISTAEELKSMKENGSFTSDELVQLACMQMYLKDYQSIGTVEEFKALKIENSELHCELQAINGTMGLLEKEISAKAIDEFAEQLKKQYQAYGIDLCLQDNDHMSYTNSCNALESYIDAIAEQMKAGGSNE